jgi:uncharacterized integral membrane protein
MADPAGQKRPLPTQRPPVPGGEGISWKRKLTIAGGAVLLLFMALNFQKVEVNFIFGSAQMPLIIALMIAAALGALVGWAAPRLRSSRHQEPEKRT